MTSRKVSHRSIGLAVVGFWLVMMGFLAYRELSDVFSSPTFRPTPGPELGQEAESWMGLYAGEDRVGHIHMNRAVENRQDLVGFRLDIEALARLNLLGRVCDLALTGSVWRPYDIARAEFDFAVQSSGYDFRIDGSLADGLLQAVVMTAGETLPLRAPVDDELVFSTGFGGVLDVPLLEVGETVRLESVDPLTLRKSPVRVRAVAEESLEIAGERLLTRRLEVRSGGLRSDVWLDGSGDVVQVTTRLGLTPLADATHVKLLNGGVESWTGLLPLIGELEIEVLEIE